MQGLDKSMIAELQRNAHAPAVAQSSCRLLGRPRPCSVRAQALTQKESVAKKKAAMSPDIAKALARLSSGLYVVTADSRGAKGAMVAACLIYLHSWLQSAEACMRLQSKSGKALIECLHCRDRSRLQVKPSGGAYNRHRSHVPFSTLKTCWMRPAGKLIVSREYADCQLGGSGKL